MKKLFLILTVLVISFAFLHADVYIKQVTKRGAFMGQEASEMTQETWLGKNKMATISQDNSMILDMTQKKVYMIMHGSKSYIEAPLPLDITSLMPEQMAPMMKQMMEGMTINVQANGQTKKVGQWNTKGYDVNMKMMGMDMKMVMWASTDVPFDWKGFASLYAEVYKAQFKMGEQFMEEYKKIEGFPVLTEVNAMGMQITTTVVDIDPNKTAGPEVYTVPAGYTKKEKLDMSDMNR